MSFFGPVDPLEVVLIFSLDLPGRIIIIFYRVELYSNINYHDFKKTLSLVICEIFNNTYFIYIVIIKNKYLLIIGKANRCSGKVRTELSDYYKSYRHKTIIKFNLKPE